MLLVSLAENTVSHWAPDEGRGEDDGCQGRTGMGCQEEGGEVLFMINESAQNGSRLTKQNQTNPSPIVSDIPPRMLGTRPVYLLGHVHHFWYTPNGYEPPTFLGDYNAGYRYAPN